MMLQELLEIVKQNGLIWFNFSGAIVAFVLGILKLLEFKKNRVSLNIKLEQDDFISRQYMDEDSAVTNIVINVDLRNMGLEPTTISEVYFYSDNELLNNIKMTTSEKNYDGMILRKFDEIRMEPNDRKTKKLYVSKDVLLSNDIKELNAKLIFKTTLKDYPKKIKLTRKEFLN